ncbi:MAG: aldo/keto reductase family protein [Gammaproteobacteria bacterium]
MDYRQLGDSDLRVSEIALGSWLTYSMGVERDAAADCINHAFELGINFIDTANVYNRGGAESLLGEVLEGRPRDSYVLATKLFFPMSATDQGLSRKQIEKQLDDSLRRLRTDFVDLYQCHRYDPDTPLEETMDGLTRAVESGKVRYVGFSEWTPEQIQAAIDIPGVVRFVSSQPQYSMLWRVIEPAVIPLCEANGIGQIVWSPLSQGVLTGKYKPGAALPANSRASSDVMSGFMDRVLEQPVLEAVSRLQTVAVDAGLSMAQLALAWVLRQKNVACAIVGASRPEQLDDNVGASGIRLSDDTLRAIDAALEDVVVREA